MKHFTWMGLTLLTLAMVAAQYNVASSPAITEEKSSTPQVAQTSADEPRVMEESAAEVKAVEEPPLKKPEPARDADQTEPETAIEASDHPADCLDPFSGISLKFTPDI